MRLTGKSLIVGEPDASSFPSGGSRATYMARTEQRSACKLQILSFKIFLFRNYEIFLFGSRFAIYFFAFYPEAFQNSLQHEMAPIYSKTNIAVDTNMLTMELMKKVAQRHGLVCLLHEKPFKGINGSGKHNNWSVSTDSGLNLLKPGDTPETNTTF